MFMWRFKVSKSIQIELVCLTSNINREVDGGVLSQLRLFDTMLDVILYLKEQGTLQSV